MRELKKTKLYVTARRIFLSYYTGQKIYKTYCCSKRKIQYYLQINIWQRIQTHEKIYRMFCYFRAWIKQKRIRLYQIDSFYHYCQLSNSNEKYIIIEDGILRPVCTPCFFEKNEECVDEYLSLNIYIAIVNDAVLIGGTGIVMAGRRCLYDAFAYDKEERLDVHFAALKWKCKHTVALEMPKTVRTKTIEQAIFLLGLASYNYYHLTVEILSRLAYIDSIEKYRSVPLLIDQVVLDVPQYREMLECINRYRHPIIACNEGELQKVKTLIYPSMNTWMPVNIRAGSSTIRSDFMIAGSALYNIRNSVGDIMARQKWKNLYISRKNATNPRIKNEKEVAALFQEYGGFEIVYTEDLSYREQVVCFSSARCIVAASGAAMTNIIYCTPGTIVGCIIPEEYNFYMYSTIGYMLGLNNVYLDAQVVERTAYIASDKWMVDLEYCRRFIKMLKELEYND